MPTNKGKRSRTSYTRAYTREIDFDSAPKDPDDVALLSPMSINKFGTLPAHMQRSYLKEVAQAYEILGQIHLSPRTGPMDAFLSKSPNRELRALAAAGRAALQPEERSERPKNKRGNEKPPPTSPWSLSRSPIRRSDPSKAGTSWRDSLLAASPHM